jgi:hypothetical protein
LRGRSNSHPLQGKLSGSPSMGCPYPQPRDTRTEGPDSTPTCVSWECRVQEGRQDAWRRSSTRSRADVPPQDPSSSASAMAASRQSARTTQPSADFSCSLRTAPTLNEEGRRGFVPTRRICHPLGSVNELLEPNGTVEGVGVHAPPNELRSHPCQTVRRHCDNAAHGVVEGRRVVSSSCEMS